MTNLRVAISVVDGDKYIILFFAQRNRTNSRFQIYHAIFFALIHHE